MAFPAAHVPVGIPFQHLIARNRYPGNTTHRVILAGPFAESADQ